MLLCFKLNEPSPFEVFFRCRTLTGSVEGVQYAKAMCHRVTGIDTYPEALLEAKAQGAEHVFNPIKDTDFVPTIKQLTNKGCKDGDQLYAFCGCVRNCSRYLAPQWAALGCGYPVAATHL